MNIGFLSRLDSAEDKQEEGNLVLNANVTKSPCLWVCVNDIYRYC